MLAETEEVDSTSEEARRRVRHSHRRPQPAAHLDASQSGDKAPEKAQDEGSK
ncbi:hypothetical protein ACU4GD_33110 [Cupriavidus basilensis]